MKKFILMAVSALFIAGSTMAQTEPYIILSADTLIFSADGGSQTINVLSNIDWFAGINPSITWISATPETGSGNGEVIISVEPRESAGGSNYHYTIAFWYGKDDLASVEVIQGYYELYGCTDPSALNYNPLATISDNSCVYAQDSILGCTDCYAENYNPNATIDNGSCIYNTTTNGISGCMDTAALSYNPLATIPQYTDCVYQSSQTIYGCNDPRALNYNPFATEYDGSCVYATEENTFIPDITETPLDTIAAQPKEDCQLSNGAGIDDAFITGFTQLDENIIIIHWAIVQNGNTIFYDVEYTIVNEGINLFYLSIICKSASRVNVTGYTIAATYEVDLGTGIVQPQGLNDFMVYPNPAGSQLQVTTYKLQDEDYCILNVAGQTIMQGKLHGETTTINVETLPSGVYYLRIANNVAKVIKN